VRHIYEEEKEHFGFIERLKKAVEEGFSLSDMFFELQKHSIEHIMAEHLEDDDEMEGIRDLTANYALDGNTGLYTRVVYSELKAFENDLMVHSRVENEILFPKAWELEKTVFARIREKAQYN
jgi:regulator of cell morphogenesis and NO signaling